MTSIAAAAVTLGCLIGWLSPAVASASEEKPQWTVTGVSRPTNFKPGDESGDDSYIVTVTNTGGGSSNGTPVTITDELPLGLSVVPEAASGEDEATHTKLSCELTSCVYVGAVGPDDSIAIRFPVYVADKTLGNGCEVPTGAVACLVNVVRVVGGGAATAAMATPTIVSDEPAGFGVAPGGSATALSTVEAGAHPDLTTAVAFNTVDAQGSLAGPPRTTVDDLPAGLVGDVAATPSCTTAEFTLRECPVGSQIGVTAVTLRFPATTETLHEPVYNLSPNPGDAAKLGFYIAGVFGVEAEVKVAPGGYGLETTFRNINEFSAELDSVSLTIWGVPADPSHNRWRWNLAGGGTFGGESQEHASAFLTNPTYCDREAAVATLWTESWEGVAAETRMPIGPFVGCDKLEIEPAMSVNATTSAASSASGLNLAINMPTNYDDAYGVVASTVEGTTVILPEGVTVNPAAGAWLQGCSESQYQAEQVAYVPGNGCPAEAKIGTVRVQSPLLSEEGIGTVYLAQPYENQFGTLLAMDVVVRFPGRGVLVKFAGGVTMNSLTGQLSATFRDLPPLPFDRFSFVLGEGAGASLATPARCGAYRAEAQIVPWADPLESLSPPIAPFEVTKGAGGQVCPAGVPPFNPRVVAGTQGSAGGSYSPFYLRIERQDGEQEITGFSTQLPPGLTGNLTGVQQCTEAEIQRAREQSGAAAEANPACPAGSEIGHTIAEAGVGTVLAQTPGRLYLGEKFEGAPFSIVSVTSAKVGPFDLGTVVVHLPLDIDPQTAQVSIPSGPADQIPHIIKGIVIHLRTIRVYVDRPDFMINPTNCGPLSLSASVIGGGSNPVNPAGYDPVTVTDPFQAVNCANLKFAPKLAVSTSGHTSKADGASLTAKLTYPAGPFGQNANIHQVKVELPKQLPSRLTTLQKACTAAQFESNPAGCPAESVVGHAKAITPILPVPLEGPAYFVSHGGEAFPNLILVLQGYGIKIDLIGDTFINKAGITSSTFKTIPDQPVTSFELTLPEGPYSALAANTDLCAQQLTMPTEFVAQNGASIHQTTPIAVEGCAPTLHIAAHTIKHGTVTLQVNVPAAGTLTATGHGLTHARKQPTKAKLVTLKLRLTASEQSFLAHHPGRRLKSTVHLTFTPTHRTNSGTSKLTGKVTVLVR